MKEIIVDEITYVAREQNYSEELMIVRTSGAGVFVCKIKERNGSEAVLLESRRIWRWEGANELTDLAENGTSCPEECRLSVIAPSRIVLGVIEILPVSKKAYKILSAIPAWEYKHD